MSDIPLVDLRAQYEQIQDEIDRAVQAVIEDTAFVRGPYVESFEEHYAKRYDVEHCVSVANGTDAIYLTLRALGVGPGDEVITTAHTWISTAETISQTGATPVFVDTGEHFTLDPSELEEKVTERTRVVIPVHLYGHPAAMAPIQEVCDRHELFLVEDCAQAHFAEYRGERVGTIGDAGTFSFYPAKNLGAFGDAGAVVTNDEELATRVRALANHGGLGKHEHRTPGVNSRLDGIHAAVLDVKLDHIQDWNEQRRLNAARYDRGLEEVPHIQTPTVHPDCVHVFHLYVIRTPFRDELREYLDGEGIATGIHYPTALPFLEAFEDLGYSEEDFPDAARAQTEILSLPMYPELTEEQVHRVVKTIKEFMEEVAPDLPDGSTRSAAARKL